MFEYPQTFPPFTHEDTPKQFSWIVREIEILHFSLMEIKSFSIIDFFMPLCLLFLGVMINFFGGKIKHGILFEFRLQFEEAGFHAVFNFFQFCFGAGLNLFF